MNTKRLCTDEDLQDPNSDDCVLSDGQRMHIPLRAMDSAPCGCGGAPMTDSASGISDDNQSMLEAKRAEAEAVGNHADYFTGQREGREAVHRTKAPEYEDMRRSLSSAWQTPAMGVE